VPSPDRSKGDTAKAIVQDSYGGADVLALRTVRDPTIGPNDVLIGVHAAGCGPDVWHVMTGLPYLARPALGIRRPRAAIRGFDVAGTVEAVGASVEGLRPGDAVMGTVDGSFAELAIGHVDKLVVKPARLSFTQAAAVPVSGTTALQATQGLGRAAPGQAVLIIGAAGGVGSLSVQIAKAAGAEVTGVCSTTKAELVRSIGADEIVDYTRTELTDVSTRWDLIVDTAGRRSLSELRGALARSGTLVIVGGDGGGRWTGGFFRGILRAPLISVGTSQRLRGLIARVNAQDLRTLSGLIDACKLTPVVDRTYPLSGAPDAVRYLAQSHPSGKIVISIQSHEATMSIRDADLLAQRAHGDARTKSGVLFIDHVRSVARRMERDPDPYAAPAALLHDSVEKGSISWQDLRDAGADDRLVAIIDALSERDGESEASYLTRAASEPLALRIKRADIADKLDQRILVTLSEPDRLAIQERAQRRLALLEDCVRPRAAGEAS
jgi:NADPH:quinone reductase-like Zn-dependent oxidoreductase